MNIENFKKSVEAFKSILESENTSPMKKGSFYHAIELSPESRNTLLNSVPPKFSKLHASHITLNFKPSDDEDKSFPHDQTVPFEVTHAAHHEAPGDVGVQAVRVTGLGDWHSKKPNMHITISTAPGSKPAQSNDLLAAKAGTPLDRPLKLTGTFKRLKR